MRPGDGPTKHPSMNSEHSDLVLSYSSSKPLDDETITTTTITTNKHTYCILVDVDLFFVYSKAQQQQ